MSRGELVWQVWRDPWRDLGPTLRAEGALTCVTAMGTTRILDGTHGRHLRQTLEGSRAVLRSDGRWLPYTSASATSCGVFIKTRGLGDREWEESGRLWAAFSGIVLDWTDISTDLGQQIILAVLERRLPPTSTEGHPDLDEVMCTHCCVLRDTRTHA